MGQCAADDVGEDFGVSVGMGAKAAFRFDKVVVEDTEGAEILFNPGTIPISEREMESAPSFGSVGEEERLVG